MDTELESQMRELVQDGVLQDRLQEAAKADGSGASIALECEYGVRSASVGDCSVDTAVQIGCLTKTITATMVAIAESEGKLNLGDLVGAHLGGSFSGLNREHFDSLKIFHLLNHTSGLDSALLDKLPRRDGGCIDVEVIRRVLDGGRPIAPPGDLFHYNDVGCWLAGAILEQVYQKPILVILREHLVRQFDVPGIETTRGDFCPSLGGCFKISARGLMSLARLHLEKGAGGEPLSSSLVKLRTMCPVELPEWPPVGKWMYPGWFDFGGSFGHYGFGQKGSALVRFFPENGTAIVVTSTNSKLATSVLARIFRKTLKDLVPTRLPPPLSASEWERVDAEMYVGEFENAKYQISITLARNGSLRAEVMDKGKRRHQSAEEFPNVKRLLQATIASTFVPTQPEAQVIPVVQFHGTCVNRKYPYMQTRKYAFARTEGNA